MAPALRRRPQSNSPAKSKTKGIVKAKPRKSAEKSRKSTARKAKSEDDDTSSEEGGDTYEASEASDVEDLDSDALDEDDNASVSAKKRKRGSTSPKKKKSPKKRRRAEDEDEEDSDDLPDGQTVVGKVMQAPTEGRVPPGQISQNTLNFFKELAKPEHNDREWFKLHEPVFRQAEKEWKDWIEEFTPLLTEVDDQIPPLPPKDVIHRIYRDVRFSNDKTPYKKGFSASFSRSGRKGVFAHFSPTRSHVRARVEALETLTDRCRIFSAIIPGGQSLVAAGAWQPGRNELATMRHHIQHNSSRLRDIISGPEFVKFFGKPSPHPKGERRNVFGGEDELKVAPKGVDKNHKDIDLLKLRSVAVIHNFLDSEVTAEGFKEDVLKVVRVMQPLVHCLNDFMTLPVTPDSESDDDGEDDG